MAWSSQLNYYPTTGGEALWALKEFLVSQGWDVPRSGSGSGGAYGDDPSTLPADVHTPGGTYAGTLDLADAWMELRQPVTASPRRSFLFKIPNLYYAPYCSIWYSSDGLGFTGGSPSATVRPTAADEEGLVNGSGVSQWLPTNYSYQMDVVAGDLTEGHSFFFGARLPSGYATVLSLDVLEEADQLDPDPAVVGTNFVNDTRFALSGAALYYAGTASQASGVSRGWYKGIGSPAFVVYPASFIGGGEGFGTQQVPVNADRLSQLTDGSFADFPIWYWRGGGYTTERGRKGRSVLYRAAQPRLGMFRPNATLTRMGVGALSIPWDGSTLPIF